MPGMYKGRGMGTGRVSPARRGTPKSAAPQRTKSGAGRTRRPARPRKPAPLGMGRKPGMRRPGMR